MEPKATDVGRKAPTPKPEDLPYLGGSLPSPPGNNDDDDSDDDHYPAYRGYVQPVQDSTETIDIPSSSTIAVPAAQDTSAIASSIAPVSPAALGATTETVTITDVSRTSTFTPTISTTSRKQSEDEVSLGDEESAPETKDPQIPTPTMIIDINVTPEAMGPQIPIVIEDTDMRTEVADENDPLEFASSYLMLYGVPTSEEFPTVQGLTSTIATRLGLTIRCICRVSDARSQSFWLELESVDDARRMRNYMHHRRENGLELLVSYADYDDYTKALS
jgi:hypothetical protein